MVEWLAGNRIRGTTAERPNFGLTSGSVGGWVELGRASNASLPDVTSLADKRYLMFLNFQESNNSRPTAAIRINGDSVSNYATRGSANGLSDYINVDQTQIMFGGQPQGDTTTVPYLTVGYIANLAGKEKLLTCHNVLSYQLGAGSSDPLERRATVFKWDNTSDPIDQLSILTTAGGSFNTNGELIVLGWDPDDTHTTNFWEELASVDLSGGAASSLDSGTFTAKKYLWVQILMEQTADSNYPLRFNSDSGSNYAYRYRTDNGTEFLHTSQTGVNLRSTTANLPVFVNMFILNNSAQEKLIIEHDVKSNTAGAGNAPLRTEQAGKWVPTTNQQITSIQLHSGSGNLNTNTIMKIWGSD